VLVIGIMYPLQ